MKNIFSELADRHWEARERERDCRLINMEINFPLPPPPPLSSGTIACIIAIIDWLQFAGRWIVRGSFADWFDRRGNDRLPTQLIGHQISLPPPVVSCCIFRCKREYRARSLRLTLTDFFPFPFSSRLESTEHFPEWCYYCAYIMLEIIHVHFYINYCKRAREICYRANAFFARC